MCVRSRERAEVCACSACLCVCLRNETDAKHVCKRRGGCVFARYVCVSSEVCVSKAKCVWSCGVFVRMKWSVCV